MASLGSLRQALAAMAILVAIAIPFGAFIACGPTINLPKPPEKCNLQIIDLTIIASPRINLTDTGEPRPVQVRLYQLATDVRLNNATFQDTWKDEKGTLKDDFIKSEELTVYPDSRTDLKFERDEKAMVLGAVALFRTPKGRSWYTMIELPPPPGKGECFTGCPNGDCGDGGSDSGKQLTPLNPHFVIWVDGSKIDEGSDHVDDYPESGRHISAHLPFNAPSDDSKGESPKPADTKPADTKPTETKAPK